MVQTLQDKVQELEAKIGLVVSKDNKVIPSLEAELARERLRHDVLKYASDIANAFFALKNISNTKSKP